MSAAVRPGDYGDVDVVLISHLHLDHLDVGSLRLLGPRAVVAGPAGTTAVLRRAGLPDARELAPGQGFAVGDVTITATPARHGGYRLPFGPSAPAIGYVVERNGVRTYFAGDTDLFPEMASLAPGLDVALLPTWGWGPRLGPGHLDPPRAAAALTLLRPRLVVPIHWGTLWPVGMGRVASGRLTAPPRDFAELAREAHPAAEVVVAEPGEDVRPRG